MVKRTRDEASSLLASQKTKQDNPTKPPEPKRCKEPSATGATGKQSAPVEQGRPEPEGNRVAGSSLHPQVVAGDVPEAHGAWDVGTAAAVLPRWWQLWLGRGGGTMVDFEELLWGWFPFVDDDFLSDSEVGLFSIREDNSEGLQEDLLYNDIWQLKHINEIPK